MVLLFDSPVQLTPGDQFNVLFLKQLAKFLTGKEIEIPLAPGSAPGLAFACGSFHFVIIECWVNDELGYTWLKIFDRRFIELNPLPRRDAGIDGDGVIEHDVVATQAGFQIGMFREPVPRDKNRKPVRVRDAKKNFKKFLAIDDQTILMRVKMRRADA